MKLIIAELIKIKLLNFIAVTLNKMNKIAFFTQFIVLIISRLFIKLIK